MSWDFVFGRLLTLVLVGHIGLILWNLRVVVRPRPVKVEPTPRVSILVPARNEEGHIGDCLRSLLDQTHPDVEILVLDDRSTDRTAAIVRAVGGDRVRLLAGDELPEGWTGKNWACHQLARAATGEVLCFVDADTRLAPDAVAAVASTLVTHDVGLVAVMLRSDTDGVAEAVLLPMVNHAVLGLFPTSLIHRSTHPDIAIGFGPFLTVSRDAYDAAGGHAAHPSHVVDDMRLARSVKAAGREIRLVNGTDLVATRWYHGLREIWQGFSKNAYGGIAYRSGLALLAVTVLMPILVLPFVRLTVGLFTGSVPGEVLLQVALLLVGRLITSIVGRDPLWTVPLHPVTVVFWAATLAWSVTLGLTGRTVAWKGRRVAVGDRRSDT